MSKPVIFSHQFTRELIGSMILEDWRAAAAVVHEIYNCGSEGYSNPLRDLERQLNAKALTRWEVSFGCRFEFTVIQNGGGHVDILTVALTRDGVPLQALSVFTNTFLITDHDQPAESSPQATAV